MVCQAGWHPMDETTFCLIRLLCKRRGKVKAVEGRRKVKAPCRLSSASGLEWRWQISSWPGVSAVSGGPSSCRSEKTRKSA